MSEDYYSILGVKKEAGAAEIKKAYRKLAMKFHPDRNPDDKEAEENFKEAAEAYEILSDAEKRSRYDRFGHAAFQGAAGGPHFGSVEDVFGAFGDIFGEFFGFGGGRSRRRSGPRRGPDANIILDLSFEEAAFGATKEIPITIEDDCTTCGGDGLSPGSTRETCSTCGGQGQVLHQQAFLRIQTACPRCHGTGSLNTNPCNDCSGKGREARKTTVKVEIPAGVDEGIQLRLGGKGHAGVRGGPPGDLMVSMRIAPHELFLRHGPNVILPLEVSVARAVLGGPVKVPTLEGEREISIPKGAQPGHVFTLKGEGIPKLHGRGRGDQLVELSVSVPKKLGSEQRKLYERLLELEGEDIGHKGPLRSILEMLGS